MTGVTTNSCAKVPSASRLLRQHRFSAAARSLTPSKARLDRKTGLIAIAMIACLAVPHSASVRYL